jgi:hypothetical protein
MPFDRPDLNNVKLRFYTSGQFMLFFGIMFAAFAEQNFKAFGVYLLGTVIIYAILTLVGLKWANATQGAQGTCGHMPWLFGNAPLYPAPSTMYYWFTLVYFITVGILQNGSSAQNAGVVSLATIFAVLDIAVTYFGNLAGTGAGAGGALAGGIGACWTKEAILIGIALGSGIGGLYGWATYEWLKGTQTGPDISCAKEGNPKRFRCKVRERTLDI